MALIFETTHFIVEAVDAPLVTRLDGGHIAISPKVRVTDRTELSPPLAIEMARLTMLTGEAMMIGMNNRGIDIGRINYQDNGNWGVFLPEGPHMHIHLYGRAKSALIQKYGEACSFPFRSTGFYDSFEPLNDGDIYEIRRIMNELSASPKYLLSSWGLS
jgi:diadenosine tetraphosphate (Ap4A) HIT family hydrolase